MKVGFSGTRMGMSEIQFNSFKVIIGSLENIESFHHGCCIGADEQAHKFMVENLKWTRTKIILHPPKNTKFTFKPWVTDANNMIAEERPAKQYLTRNRDIVDETDLLVATPFSRDSTMGGGTWYTINYARNMGKIVYTIFPDGGMHEFKKEDHTIAKYYQFICEKCGISTKIHCKQCGIRQAKVDIFCDVRDLKPGARFQCLECNRNYSFVGVDVMKGMLEFIDRDKQLKGVKNV